MAVNTDLGERQLNTMAENLDNKANQQSKEKLCLRLCACFRA